MGRDSIVREEGWWDCGEFAKDATLRKASACSPEAERKVLRALVPPSLFSGTVSPLADFKDNFKGPFLGTSEVRCAYRESNHTPSN